MFDAALIRRIIKNPVYCGKIAYGRRKTEKIHGTRNDYHLVEQDDYLLVDGLHEAIVSEDVWNVAQEKIERYAKKYEHVNKQKNEKVHMLSGIIKCPVCGAGCMVIRVLSIEKTEPDIVISSIMVVSIAI